MTFRLRPVLLRTVALTLALATLTTAACSGGSSDSPDDGNAATGSAQPTTVPDSDRGGGPGAGAATVPELLDVEAPAVGGGTVTFADYAGDALALWFWAPW